jgi:hypothetical protein
MEMKKAGSAKVILIKETMLELALSHSKTSKL